jgi:hypothetical protein
MSEFQLTHIALVGARIEAFKPYGIKSRNELKMRRIAPKGIEPTCIGQLSATQQRETLTTQFPVWIHNIITDPSFPKRTKLLMPLRRFEGELKDKKDNEVVSAVMSAGFKSETLDPLDLPLEMPMQRRCSMVAQMGVWKEAYQRLQDEIVSIMSAEAPAIGEWCKYAQQPGRAIIDVEQAK